MPSLVNIALTILSILVGFKVNAPNLVKNLVTKGGKVIGAGALLFTSGLVWTSFIRPFLTLTFYWYVSVKYGRIIIDWMLEFLGFGEMVEYFFNLLPPMLTCFWACLNIQGAILFFFSYQSLVLLASLALRASKK